ncbi:hypothetical protein M8C21_014001 [Ambrosia artemisiifolia]|uniref:Hydroxyproline-rich glycoprotein family protein n=1 Tax=Ambrosia artemisiifolia TaxID=4212 RepID=A0AAD5GJ17_AMBAR|nr:hypothetical protein M8C21_014001 [Ambrosia artemisiifolia]
MEVVVKLMEAPSYNAPSQYHHNSNRPTIGFPLGTALLLIVVFTLSGVFSCCYHWDKLRHLRGQFSDDDVDRSTHPPNKPKPDCLENKRDEDHSLPVIMAGDQFPRFIAMPCACEQPAQEKINVGQIQMPHKPPHVVIPMYQ